MVYSDALHTARSSTRRVLEACRDVVDVQKSVGEMTPPCGTPRLFVCLLVFLFLFFLCVHKCPSSFTLADLSCRKHRIHLYILPERHSQVSLAGDLYARLCTKLLAPYSVFFSFFCFFFNT